MPGDPLPTLAIVIASKNRFHDIRACLSSIRNQPTQPDQIIVVDQSTPPYDLSEFEPIVHIRNSQIAGLTAARNAGLDELNSEIALFLDDDVELLTDCVANVKMDFVRRPQAIALGLSIKWPQPQGAKSRLWNLVFEHGFFNRAPIRRQDGTELRTLVGCAMAYRSRLFECERFDELLTGYALGEDWEFSARSRRYGELWLCDGARVVHFVSPANRLSLQRARKDRWLNFLYFYDKLGARELLTNHFCRAWWMFGESLRWLNLGMGLPRRTDRFSRSQCFDRSDRLGASASLNG